MALNAFLTIPGIKGSARQKTREGKITLVGFDHTVGVKADPKTGFPTAEEAPQVAICTKEFDLASPALHDALHNGTSLGTVTVEFWRMPPAGGPEENHLTIAFTGVRVAYIRTMMKHMRYQDHSLVPEHEQVALAYSGMKVAYKAADGNKESESHVVEAFEDWNGALGDMITDAVKTGAAELASALGGKIKDAAAGAVGGEGGG
jgi:type VI secretion system Hcp family effector